MRIENIVYLIKGELKNSPSIKKIDGFSCNIEKIKRGDLFFAKDKKDIDIAVHKGAYAIIFEDFTQILDSEIAWIKTKNIEEAALKLFRFFLIQKSTPIYLLSPLEFDIAKEICSKEALFIENSFLKALESFYRYNIKSIFIKNINTLNKLALDYKEPKIDKKINIIKTYIFESSFIYDNIFYERLQIAPIFLDNLNKVLNILDENSIKFNIKDIEKLDHFRPYFINNSFLVKEFGRGEKVIIVEKCHSLLRLEREFLENRAKWNKKIYISDKKIEGFIFEKRFDKIRLILNESNFNFALIGIKDFKVEKLKKRKIENLLF